MIRTFKKLFNKNTHNPIPPTDLIVGNNNIIEKQSDYLFHLNITINGNNNKVLIKKDCNISNIVINIQGDNHYLEIGSECRISGGMFWLEHTNCKIIIGAKTTIEWAHIAATEDDKSIVIGEDCMFSDNISIRTSDSHSIIDMESNKRINQAKSVSIGDHVWIGAHVKVLKGVHIGNHSVISMGAIVTKNIPNNSIAGGIPARVIKKNTDWMRELL
ncbi:DapH/DapD/GlmU-related protein [uncultured Aquimarina sp.]|uniref:acyltransferase n=1 Tax=uncultured Aquimarina sp. TaxID=575652 RepID=UPI00260DDD94|nr:acyltransferase [uncultured Aquimarina sp.]